MSLVAVVCGCLLCCDVAGVLVCYLFVCVCFVVVVAVVVVCVCVAAYGCAMLCVVCCLLFAVC